MSPKYQSWISPNCLVVTIMVLVTTLIKMFLIVMMVMVMMMMLFIKLMISEVYPNNFRRSFRWCKSHVCILTGTLEIPDHFSQSEQNHEKSMFVKSIKDHSGDV